MDKAEKYLTHASGIYGMLSWVKEQEQSGTPIVTSNNTIYIHHLTARYFCLAVGKDKNKKVFLAIQPNESSWIKLISWSHFVIKENDLNLYLVSNIVEGDENDFPDIPSFAIAIPFDMESKIEILRDLNSLDMKEFRMEDNKVYINLKTKITDELKIKKISKTETHIENTGYFDYHQVLLNKESLLISKFENNAPVFKGDENQAKSIYSKFWSKLDEVFEKDKTRAKEIEQLKFEEKERRKKK